MYMHRCKPTATQVTGVYMHRCTDVYRVPYSNCTIIYRRKTLFELLSPYVTSSRTRVALNQRWGRQEVLATIVN